MIHNDTSGDIKPAPEIVSLPEPTEASRYIPFPHPCSFCTASLKGSLPDTNSGLYSFACAEATAWRPLMQQLVARCNTSALGLMSWCKSCLVAQEQLWRSKRKGQVKRWIEPNHSHSDISMSHAVTLRLRHMLAAVPASNISAKKSLLGLRGCALSDIRWML